MIKNAVFRFRVLAVFLLLALPLCQAREHGPVQSSTQLVVVTTSDWDAVEGRLQRYQRSGPGKEWRPVGAPVNVVVGKNGLGWGSGIVSADALEVSGASDPVKKEGDGKAPAGFFRLSRAFGYADREPSGWKMPYVSLTPTVECVDDSASRFYNRVVDRTQVPADWNSSEHMLRGDDLYRWGIVVDHNSGPPKPGVGSCIFLHIWRGPGQGTVGCTAMPQKQLQSILEWLDPARKPLLVQLPFLQYERLKRAWDLPSTPNLNPAAR
jgi:L,D-peptidoglycan transpeptidase YkuD (ErfK/YbiS/YcfS/YnhG family)